MSPKRILVFAGTKSQTGIATLRRFPGLELEGVNDFDDIARMITTEPALAILPLWNSHEGEIPKTNVLDMVFERDVKIQELWSKEITFELICRPGTAEKNIKKVISVRVAKSQCSEYLAGKDFQEMKSTVEAYKEFEKSENFDAVLCPPDLYEQGKFIQLRNDVSNPANFTTFGLLGNVNWKHWSGKSWAPLRSYGLPKSFILSGIEMSIPSPSGLSEDQQDLFDDMTLGVNHLDEIPRIIFIARRGSSRCGLILESKTYTDVLIPSGDNGTLTDIQVKEELGETKDSYVGNILNFMEGKFPNLLKHDFIKHLGHNTCLFACPTLNVITHGFEENLTEMIVRRTINKYFELIDNGVPCSDAQRRLFEKYKQNYYDKGLGFINFIKAC
ncbi:MAG: prephenate dehydratase domain-containing protein [Candidatus Altiarchaeota archaeon]